MTGPGGSAVLLQIRGLTVALPKGAERARAVDGIDLELRRGRVLCLVGESGSGKSMTAHAVMGLVPPPLRVSGRITLAGQDLLTLRRAEHRALRGRRMGMVFQEPMAALNPVMRVGEQIAEVFRYHGVPGPHDARITALLAAMGLPDPDSLRHAYPHRLSGGQRQRVMIAIALALDPELLIADEPTTALDVTTQQQILTLLRRTQAARDLSILLITHDFGVVAELGHDVAVMQEGRVVETGTVQAVLGDPQHPYTRELLAAVPRLEPRHAAGGRPTAPPLLEVRGVVKTYVSRSGLFGPRRVVEAVKAASFGLAHGETLGIVGESGSGKSTLARIIVRLLGADAGEVRLAGVARNLLELGARELKPVRRRVQMVFQDPQGSLNPRRTVFEIVAQGLLAHGWSRSDARARVDELLRLVALDPGAAERYPTAFSGGQRQRIGLARALALEPEVIVADEPVSALDVSIQARILELLADLQRRLRLGLLFITHDLRVAARICDRVAVMQQGRIVELGPAAEVLFHPTHAYTRLLIDSIPGRHAFGGGDVSATASARSSR